METIIERLNKLTTKLTDLGTTMYSKWGTESYVERCDNADIRDEIIRVIERLKTLPIEPAEVSEEITLNDLEIILTSSTEGIYVNDEQRIGWQKGAKYTRDWFINKFKSLPQSQKTESAEEIDRLINWLKASYPIEDITVDAVRFVMKQYAQSHQASQEARPTDEDELNNTLLETIDVMKKTNELLNAHKK